MVKSPPANTRDVGSIPGSTRFPVGGNDNPTPVFLSENSMDRGASQATVPRLAKSQT